MLLFMLGITLAWSACVGMMVYCEPTMLAAADLFQPLAQAAPVVGVIALQALVAMQPAALVNT